MPTTTTPDWLRKRVNDPYGTPNRHPFWTTIQVERIGDWKVFEIDGVWRGYDTRHNAWAHFTDEADARAFTAKGTWDVWA